MQVNLTNTAKKLCIIGDPVLHSKSPLLQNTMISTLGLDYIYLCQPVKAGETAAWVEAAKRWGYTGFNATMPHKEALLPLMDELDQDAEMYRAVNTVCIRSGKIYGYNTDGRGFLASLQAEGIDPIGKRAVVLGSGGAAKAVGLKLVQAGVKSLTICNRTVEKAETLCKYDTAVMTPSGFDANSLRQACQGADLLVNGTSLGMAGTGGQFEDFSFLDALPSHAVVYDAIYHPAETELLRRAKARDLKSLNGLGMLLYQAVFALEHFTDTHIDARAMAELLRPRL